MGYSTAINEEAMVLLPCCGRLRRYNVGARQASPKTLQQHDG